MAMASAANCSAIFDDINIGIGGGGGESTRQIMSMAGGNHHHLDNIANVPLRKWIEDDAKRDTLERRAQAKKGQGGSDSESDLIILLKKMSFLRRTAVALGVVELMKQAPRAASSSSQQQRLTSATVNLDNFIVHHDLSMRSFGQVPSLNWNDVRAVSMISPSISAQLIEPSFLAYMMDEAGNHDNDRLGRFFEVHMALPDHIANANAAGPGQATSDSNDCRLFGILLYELYSGMRPFPAYFNDRISSRGDSQREANNGNGNDVSHSEGPLKKRSTVRYDKRKGKSYSTLQSTPYTPLHELGLPSSICMMVHNLIDGHDAYTSLDAAREDIHLLISDPDCFLFDIGINLASQDGCMQPRFKKGKMYGREKEVSLITEAFVRVTCGTNGAFFIKGYSGCGKSTLVQSLTARVDIAGGAYVLAKKMNEMSKEKPMLDVLSCFDNLCLLVKDRSSAFELLEMSTKLMQEFESDFSVLAWLLPNITVLFPQLGKSEAKDKKTDQKMMSLHNVCFTLQRFLRIVSSRLKPVMLFLDDLQWVGKNSLKVIEALLGTRGSSCLFFVGTYRSNEVDQDHPICDLISSLEKKAVATTEVDLCGLSQGALNTLLSDALCIFPRLCKPLSEIVLEKTKGNPHFALEFLRSLCSRKLLRYSLREKRWIWDEAKIHSENITDNVLYLISAKITQLSENIQTSLKVASCFGSIDDSVVAYLSKNSQHSGLLDWLNLAVTEGCIHKVGDKFKLVHDKVREASYALIPESNKQQFHYDIGMLLYSATKEQEDLGELIFQVADQVNHGIPGLVPPNMQIEIAELNVSAGTRAFNSSHYEIAQSYLNYSVSLLPKNHWETQYELSLRVFHLKAKASYLCGDLDKAQEVLKQLVEKGRCLGDILNDYHLYVTILHTEQKDEGFRMCVDVLSQLNETVPETLDKKQIGKMMKETGAVVKNISDDTFLQMKDMEGVHCFTLKFYTLLQCISFWNKPEIMPFVGCRMIQLSLEHGMCQDSVFGFVQYAAIICQQGKLVTELQEACRIGKLAMSFSKRFNSEIEPMINFCYWGFVGVIAEPWQLCAHNLRRGFEVGMSAGESAYAFYNAMRRVSNAMISGENLSSLLKETDYYLELATRFRSNLSLPSLAAWRETISTLIDKGEATKSPTAHNDILEELTKSNSVYARRHNQTVYINRVIQAFWLGYSQRCHHYAKKALDVPTMCRHNKLVIHFYSAINAFRGIKNNNGNGSQFIKVKATYKDAISALRSATEVSAWNFTNKVYLLEAELYSFEKNYEEARASYAAAITSSCSSRFIHEQGLACELAGLHYKKIGQPQAALDFFQRAKECYVKWGSEMKVESITQQIDGVVSMSLLQS